MKIAILIILYITGVISIGVYLYKRHKSENYNHIVDETELFMIMFISLFFPIFYIFGLLMIIIKKIGDKLCKDR